MSLFPLTPDDYKDRIKPDDYDTNRDKTLSFERLVTETEASYLLRIKENHYAWLGKRFSDVYSDYTIRYSKYISPNRLVSEKWKNLDAKIMQDPQAEQFLKSGDQVWCKAYGNGTVTDLHVGPGSDERPRCRISFSNCSYYYYSDNYTYIGMHERNPDYTLTRGHNRS